MGSLRGGACCKVINSIGAEILEELNVVLAGPQDLRVGQSPKNKFP